MSHFLSSTTQSAVQYQPSNRSKQILFKLMVPLLLTLGIGCSENKDKDKDKDKTNLINGKSVAAILTNNPWCGTLSDAGGQHLLRATFQSGAAFSLEIVSAANSAREANYTGSWALNENQITLDFKEVARKSVSFITVDTQTSNQASLTMSNTSISGQVSEQKFVACQ